MYVPDLDVTAQEYTDAMTLSGTKVEGFEKLDADLDKIVIGQIEKIEKHTGRRQADRMPWSMWARETVQIVTGSSERKSGRQGCRWCWTAEKVAGNHDGKMTPGGIPIRGGEASGRGIPRHDVLH